MHSLLLFCIPSYSHWFSDLVLPYMVWPLTPGISKACFSLKAAVEIPIVSSAVGQPLTQHNHVHCVLPFPLFLQPKLFVSISHVNIALMQRVAIIWLSDLVAMHKSLTSTVILKQGAENCTKTHRAWLHKSKSHCSFIVFLVQISRKNSWKVEQIEEQYFICCQYCSLDCSSVSLQLLQGLKSS